MFSQQTEEWDLKNSRLCYKQTSDCAAKYSEVDQRKQEITASKGMLLPSVSASTSQNYSLVQPLIREPISVKH
jgi:outer membrane protein